MDEERRNLERKASTGDPEALTKLQVLNERSGLRDGDVAYLEEYIALSEKFVGGGHSLEKINRELEKLNDKYKMQVGPNRLKTNILGEDLPFDEDGWFPSSMQC